ncbi:unnamed protein product [Linum tenue]|uniref:Uncharacterized protein n=1 Tax=Linum tenue TaxID=586396 RepID=A0AAV0LGV7_9ROSI|nr:unnamed protein product [Linum tenue]
MGSSCFFLLQARVIEEGEEGTEKKISATSCFITGQHIHKHFFDDGSTTGNSMRKLSIQCVFLNNFIFQLFNHFLLPSSMLTRKQYF